MVDRRVARPGEIRAWFYPPKEQRELMPKTRKFEELRREVMADPERAQRVTAMETGLEALKHSMDYLYAYTGRLNSERIHVAKNDGPFTYRPFISKQQALCGIEVKMLQAYRPNPQRLRRRRCSKCFREARQLGLDPLKLGWREDEL